PPAHPATAGAYPHSRSHPTNDQATEEFRLNNSQEAIRRHASDITNTLDDGSGAGGGDEGVKAIAGRSAPPHHRGLPGALTCMPIDGPPVNQVRL
ncbi:hypothetical protein ACFY04_42350, partial [Streptomyces sp. NPDC001549]|uniref:hypothetical protein n=1 Tax=Streptomyces sp. NPDC001549 TaxID=3364586 RepID=UPI00368F4087